MAQKFNSKNLSYTSKVPPFIAALQAQASGATGPDPILSSQRRSVKKRSDSEEAEDAPLVVDEEGNTLEVEIAKDGTVKEDKPIDVKLIEEPNSTAVEKKEEDNKTSFGSRKRKTGKVIGDSADGDGDGDIKSKTESKVTKEADGASDKKIKKKAKKIKLSFEED